MSPALAVADPDNLAFLTQTTLSVDDTAAIVDALEGALPGHPARRAARTFATRPPTARRRSRRSPRECERMLVIGAPNSSNSLRLAEVAERDGRAGAADRARRPTSTGTGSASPQTLGITAGASAPEVLVREVVDALARALRRAPRKRPSISPSGWSSSCRASWSPDAVSELPKVEMFTDGACRGNPGPGRLGGADPHRARASASCRAASR